MRQGQDLLLFTQSGHRGCPRPKPVVGNVHHKIWQHANLRSRFKAGRDAVQDLFLREDHNFPSYLACSHVV